MTLPTATDVDARMALLNLQLALTKLRAIRDDLEDTRDQPERLSQVRLAIIRVSGAIQEVERI